jgi:hypothetical protein
LSLIACIARCRLRIKPVNRHVKHCRIVHGTGHLREASGRDVITADGASRDLDQQV